MPYTRNLKAHRGTDNRILFEFVNQDQKPVDVVGIEFTFRMISSDGETLLIEKPLEIVNKGKGQARVVLTEQELDSITPGMKGFSMEQEYVPFAWTPIEPAPPIDPDDGANIQPVYPPVQNCSGLSNPLGPVDPVNPEDFQDVDFEPAYVDDNAGGRGNIEIFDSIMPSFVSSNIVTIPASSGLTDEYNSSIINTNAQELHTFQLIASEFSGSIIFQGGTDTDNQWYDITSSTYSLMNGTIITNLHGYHPYIRINFKENTTGRIIEVKYR